VGLIGKGMSGRRPFVKGGWGFANVSGAVMSSACWRGNPISRWPWCWSACLFAQSAKRARYGACPFPRAS